ncbi:MAG TPA: metallophosphoesterase [Gemmatimonadaceae bacterium]|nr:metallophosphoesterase [Gemmatimonadaceae bacterium]
MTTVFHVSDLHFGWPAVPEQIEAIEQIIQLEKYDVVAISGDVSQRARAGEFQRAAAFIRDARKVSKVIIVPGNHDVKWWRAPLGIRDRSHIYENYRRFIDHDLEPVLRVPGATFVGLNTSHGVTWRTLTWNMRDISIIGDIHKHQLDKAKKLFEDSPSGDARVIVMHHNPVRGELSQRHGLKNTQKILGAFAEMGVDLVCCGHDHQESVHYIEHTRKGTVISTAGTVSNRSRGGRPSSVNVIDIGCKTIDVITHVWSKEQGTFVQGPHKCFKRSEYVAAE